MLQPRKENGCSLQKGRTSQCPKETRPLTPCHSLPYSFSCQPVSSLTASLMGFPLGLSPADLSSERFIFPFTSGLWLVSRLPYKQTTGTELWTCPPPSIALSRWMSHQSQWLLHLHLLKEIAVRKWKAAVSEEDSQGSTSHNYLSSNRLIGAMVLNNLIKLFK